MNVKDETKEHQKRYYCPSCLESKLNESKKSSDDWVELYEYITELYGHKPTGMMFKQLGDYRKDPYNYTNKGMLLTLMYFYETLGKKVDDSKGLGIIPFIYEQAKQNYIINRDINSYNSNAELYMEKKYIKVKQTKNKNNRKPINFDELEVKDEQ